MDFEPFYVILGIVGIGAGLLAYRKLLSPDARDRRRRQRNYGRTIQKANRPMVKFTVNSPGEKK